MSRNYKILGINDEQISCDCCGKRNLKKTVILDNGIAEIRVGVNCASTLVQSSKTKISNTAAMAERERTRTIKYYILKNETKNVWVGGNYYPKQFATLQEANSRIAAMQLNGLVGVAYPCFAD